MSTMTSRTQWGLLLLCIQLAASAAAVGVFQTRDAPVGPLEERQMMSDPFVVPGRYRAAYIDGDVLFGAVHSGSPLTFNLFSDLRIVARYPRIEELEGGSSFVSGRLDGGGHFTLLLHHSGIIRGEVHSTRGLYTVRSTARDYDRVLIAQKDLSELPGCDHDTVSMTRLVEMDVSAAREAAGAASVTETHAAGLEARSCGIAGSGATLRPGMAPASKTIDVLMLYTQQVEIQLGGTQQVGALMVDQVAKMNLALERSGLAHRTMRIAGVEKMEFLLGARSADRWAPILPLFDQHEADMAHHFADEPDIVACGTFWGSGAPGQNYHFNRLACEHADNPTLCMYNEFHKDSDRPYAWTQLRCVDGHTFAHEVGHVLSLRHDRRDFDLDHADDISLWAYHKYGFGFGNREFTNTCQLTVMSYASGCFDTATELYRLGNYEVGRFSNSDLFFPSPAESGYADLIGDISSFKEDTPMGVRGNAWTADPDGPADSARALNDVWDFAADISESLATGGPHCEE